MTPRACPPPPWDGVTAPRAGVATALQCSTSCLAHPPHRRPLPFLPLPAGGRGAAALALFASGSSVGVASRAQNERAGRQAWAWGAAACSNRRAPPPPRARPCRASPLPAPPPPPAPPLLHPPGALVRSRLSSTLPAPWLPRTASLPRIFFFRAFLWSVRCHLGSQRSGLGGGPGLAGSKLVREWWGWKGVKRAAVSGHSASSSGSAAQPRPPPPHTTPRTPWGSASCAAACACAAPRPRPPRASCSPAPAPPSRQPCAGHWQPLRRADGVEGRQA